MLPLLLAGCGFSEKSLLGKWTGRVQISDEAKKEAKDKPLTAAAQAFAENFAFPIEFRADHTYTSRLGEGTWTYSEHKVSLVPKGPFDFQIAGANGSAAALVLDVSQDGRQLTFEHNTSATNQGYVFTRDDAQ